MKTRRNQHKLSNKSSALFPAQMVCSPTILLPIYQFTKDCLVLVIYFLTQYLLSFLAPRGHAWRENYQRQALFIFPAWGGLADKLFLKAWLSSARPESNRQFNLRVTSSSRILFCAENTHACSHDTGSRTHIQCSLYAACLFRRAAPETPRALATELHAIYLTE